MRVLFGQTSMSVSAIFQRGNSWPWRSISLVTDEQGMETFYLDGNPINLAEISTEDLEAVQLFSDEVARYSQMLIRVAEKKRTAAA